jgi:hypothetical protein
MLAVLNFLLLFLVLVGLSSPYSSYSPLGPRALSVPSILVVDYIIASIVVIAILTKFNTI